MFFLLLASLSHHIMKCAYFLRIFTVIVHVFSHVLLPYCVQRLCSLLRMTMSTKRKLFHLGPSIKDVHKKYVVLHSPMSAFGITPSTPRGRLHFRSFMLALDTKFHANQACSYSQLISSSHHQNLAASADESDTAVVSFMQ